MTPDRNATAFLKWLKQGAHLDPETSNRLEKLVLLGQHGVLDVLLQFSSFSDVEIASFFSEFLCTDLRRCPEKRSNLDLGPVPTSWQAQNSLIISGSEDTPVIYVADPFDTFPIAAAEYALERQVSISVLPRSQIHDYYQSDDARNDFEDASDWVDDDESERLRELSSQTPTVRLVNELLSDAVRLAASDIHIEPVQNAVNIRLRIGGELQSFRSYEKSQQQALITRIKVLANLNLAERRLPQDGRCRVLAGGETRDFRVATMPSIFGETIVLRILNRDASKLTLENLGLGNTEIATLQRLTDSPNGLVLISGPTGSGKTTTLYALLARLDATKRKIFTIEDPIEYRLEGITQTQIDPNIGLTYATALRSVLRHDPDVILVGEIRDRETAAIAIQAAMTGHLVLATVHTNSALGAATRLRDMGIEPYLLAGCLRGVIGQRLVRRNMENEEHLQSQPSRQAVCEILELSPALLELVAGGATEELLLETAQVSGFVPLKTVMQSYVDAGMIDPSSLAHI